VNRQFAGVMVFGILLALLALADGIHKLSVPPADPFDKSVGVAFVLLSLGFMASVYFARHLISK
jgi:hypothetical protein